MNKFTAKNSGRAGFSDIFLDGQKIGEAMSMGSTYGEWKIISFYNKDLKSKLSAIDPHYDSHNTRKQLLQRLNYALSKIS